MNSDRAVEVFRTVVWSAGAGCHGNCGQKLYVKDGKLIKVEGDENHPWNQGRACPRVLALTQYVYHPDRITHPLKRVGQRGEGKFEPISWDEAFDTCEKELKRFREESGAESVIFCQGTARDVGGPISFLSYNYGSPNWCQLGLSGHSCYTPRLGGIKVTEYILETFEEKPSIFYLPFPTTLCNLCAERVKNGEKPAGVKHCQATCMQYGPVEELAKEMANKSKMVLFTPR